MATTCEDQQAMMATEHEDQKARRAEEVDATFWEVFSETSSIDLVRLLPWCISTCWQSWHSSHTLHEWGTGYQHAMNSGGPCGCHCSIVQRATGPGLHKQPWTPNWASTSSHSSHVRHSPHWHPPVGAHALSSSSILSTQSRIAPPMIDLVGGPVLTLLKPMSAVGTAHHSWNTTRGTWQWHGCLWQYWITQQWGQHQTLWWWVNPRWMEGECSWLWFGISLWVSPHLLRHRRGGHQNCTKEVLEKGVGLL